MTARRAASLGVASRAIFAHGPAKLLRRTAARAAGVTHIIEEGREGGLSAYRAGCTVKVTSVEYLHSTKPHRLCKWRPTSLASMVWFENHPITRRCHDGP